MAVSIRKNPDTVSQCLFCGRMASVLSWFDSGKDEDPVILHCKNHACEAGDALLRVMDINDLDLLLEPHGDPARTARGRTGSA